MAPVAVPGGGGGAFCPALGTQGAEHCAETLCLAMVSARTAWKSRRCQDLRGMLVPLGLESLHVVLNGLAAQSPGHLEFACQAGHI